MTVDQVCKECKRAGTKSIVQSIYFYYMEEIS
jgi:hypothetical protein